MARRAPRSCGGAAPDEPFQRRGNVRQRQDEVGYAGARHGSGHAEELGAFLVLHDDDAAHLLDRAHLAEAARATIESMHRCILDPHLRQMRTDASENAGSKVERF